MSPADCYRLGYERLKAENASLLESLRAAREAFDAAMHPPGAPGKMRETFIAFRKELAAAEQQRDEARDWVRRLTKENVLTCVYCGHAYPPGTPAHGAPVLTEHIKVCTKHPLRAAEQRNTELGGVLRQARENGIRGRMPPPEWYAKCDAVLHDEERSAPPLEGKKT